MTLDYDGVEEFNHLVKSGTLDWIRKEIVTFELPDGMNQVDVLLALRVISDIDDFDSKIKYVREALKNKRVVVLVKNHDDKYEKIGDVIFPEPSVNIAHLEPFVSSPFLLDWLISEVIACLGKTLPMPSQKTRLTKRVSVKRKK